MFKPLRVIAPLVLALIDITIFHSILFGAFQLRFTVTPIELPNILAYLKLAPAYTVSFLYLFHAYGLYARRSEDWGQERVAIFSALMVNTGAQFALSYALSGAAFPRLVFLAAFPASLAAVLLWRYVAWRLTRARAQSMVVVCVGRASEIARVAAMQGVTLSTRLYGCLTEEAPPGFAVVPLLGSLTAMVESPPVGDVWLLMPSVSLADRRWLTQHCLAHGIAVAVVPDLYEILLVGAREDKMEDIPLLLIGREKNSLFEVIKRLLDLVVAVIGLVAAAPVMAVIALLILAESGRPVLFIQERLGMNGRVFRLWKFRTMRQDAEKATGPVFAAKADPRATRLGNLLRQTRLDELPQLFNVLVGDMSIVGPRPERPFFVEQFEREIPGYQQRHGIRPGLTGLAQTAGKYDTPVEDKLRFDLLYTYSRSVATDLRVILRTVVTVLRRRTH